MVAPPQPPPSYPYDTAAPAQRPGVNGMAIAALVFGILGGILFALIFGILALVKIRRTGQRGKGLAITGLVLAGVWLIVVVAILLVASWANLDSHRGSTGQINTAGNVDARSLRPGDCLNDLQEGEQVRRVPAVPCAQPHDGEVFAVIPVTAPSWPGTSVITGQAEEGCPERLADYAPAAAQDQTLNLIYLHPTEQSWRQGDREIVCIAVDPTKKRTGSLRG